MTVEGRFSLDANILVHAVDRDAGGRYDRARAGPQEPVCARTRERIRAVDRGTPSARISAEDRVMPKAIKRTVRVKPGGVVEIRAPELPEGARAEVIVLIETDEARQERVERLSDLLARTQTLPQAQLFTDDEIAADIAAWRAAQR